jgi:ESF2/ABP1 family protein
VHAARLRVELSQSRREQQEYLKNVELARVLDKRAQRKKQTAEDFEQPTASTKPSKRERAEAERNTPQERKRQKVVQETTGVENTTQKQLKSVLSSIF